MTITADFSQLPQYRCHKVVRAAKIVAISGDSSGYVVYLDLPGDGSKTVVVAPEVFARGKPTENGFSYLVVYDDGYVSWSPAKAFEEGYALVADADREVTDVAWAILAALHQNIPEADRPMSWSDVAGDQEQRIKDAAAAAIYIVRGK